MKWFTHPLVTCLQTFELSVPEGLKDVHIYSLHAWVFYKETPKLELEIIIFKEVDSGNSQWLVADNYGDLI